MRSEITIVLMALLPGSKAVCRLFCIGAVCSGCHESIFVLWSEHSLLERVQAVQAELHGGSCREATTGNSVALLKNRLGGTRGGTA